MTIGAIARSQMKEGEENEDFRILREERDRVEQELGLQGLELSMGMSEDFEEVRLSFPVASPPSLVHVHKGDRASPPPTENSTDRATGNPTRQRRSPHRQHDLWTKTRKAGFQGQGRSGR